MRRVSLIVLPLVVLGFVAANASAVRGARAATHVACKVGYKRAVVAGASTCLKAGQTCSAKRRADYTRAGFTCTNGRLKVSAAALGTTRLASSPGGSRATAVPLGKPGVLGNGWTVTVTGVNTDAANAILAADPANNAPLPGTQYVLVAVSATYVGEGSSHLTPGTSFHAVGASGVAHSTSNSFCGKLPSPNLDIDNPLTLKGKTITGYAACWMVSAADVPTLAMYWQPLLSTDQVWFALR